jgi:hypothetical protein
LSLPCQSCHCASLGIYGAIGPIKKLEMGLR